MSNINLWTTSVGSGWVPIILELDKKLLEIDPNYKIEQIKEKFGSLRTYCSCSDEIKEDKKRLFFDTIDLYEAKANKICENCGSIENVTTAGPGWIKTYCKKCRG